MSNFHQPLASIDDSEELEKLPSQNESNNIRISSDSNVFLSAENEQQMSIPKIPQDEINNTMIIKDSTVQDDASNTLTPNNSTVSIPGGCKEQLAKSKIPQDEFVKSPLPQDEANNMPSDLTVSISAEEDAEEQITTSKISPKPKDTLITKPKDTSLFSLDESNQINDKSSFKFLEIDTQETYYSVPSPKETQQPMFEDQMVLINKEFVNDLSLNCQENGNVTFEPLITSTQKKGIDEDVQIESPYFEPSEGFGSMDVQVGTEEFVTNNESNLLKNLGHKIDKKRNKYMLLIDKNFENKLKENASDMSQLEDAEELNFMPIKRRKLNTSAKGVANENINAKDETRCNNYNQDIRKENDKHLRQTQSKNERLIEKESSLNLKNLENQSGNTKVISKENINVENLRKKETSNVGNDILKMEISEKTLIIIKFNNSRDGLKEIHYILNRGDIIEGRTLIEEASTSKISKNTDEIVQIGEAPTSVGNQLNTSDKSSDVSFVEKSDDESDLTVFIKTKDSRINTQNDKKEVQSNNPVNPQNETENQCLLQDAIPGTIGETMFIKPKDSIINTQNDKKEVQSNNPVNPQNDTENQCLLQDAIPGTIGETVFIKPKDSRINTQNEEREVQSNNPVNPQNETENQCLLQDAMPGPNGEGDFENRHVKLKCFNCNNLCTNVIKKRIGKSKHIVVCECDCRHLILFNENNKLNYIKNLIDVVSGKF